MKTRNLQLLLLMAMAGVAMYAQPAGPTVSPSGTIQKAYTNESYSLQYTCTGCGAGTQTWSVVAGTLPPGLNLSSSGTLSGTPTSSGVYSLDVGVAVNNQPLAHAQNTFYTDVRLQFLTNANLGTVTAGTPVNRAIQVSAPGLTDSSGIPANLTVSFKTGDTTATVSGSFAPVSAPTRQSFTLYAANRTTYFPQSISQVFTFLVNPRPTLSFNLPSGQVGSPYSGTVRVVGGTSPFTFSVSGAFPPGLQLDPATGNISGTPTAGGSFTFTPSIIDASSATASAPVTLIIVALAPTITTSSLPNGTVGTPYVATTLAASGGAAPYSWTAPTGTLPAGLTLTTAGVLSGTPTVAGSSNVTIQVIDSLGQAGTKTFTIVVTAGLSITTTTLPDGVVKVAYAGKISATGGTTPYSFSLSGGTALPAGLTLANTGDITGTPTTAGTYNFTIAVFDATQKTATQSYKVTINPGLAFSTTSLTPGQRGKAYSAQLTATGGLPAYAFTISAGTLPAGLTLATGGGISGTPTVSGTSNFTVRLNDQAGTAVTQAFSIVVTDPVTGPTISTLSVPDGTVGVDYSATFFASGTGPFTWLIPSGTPPPGLTISSSGVLSGKPTAAGTYTFLVQVLDGSQPQLTAFTNFTIKVVLPSLPAVSVTTVSDTTTSSSQPTFGISLGQTFPVDLAGTATLVFTPDQGPGDPDVKFLNGKTTMNFSVPAGSSVAASTGDKLGFSAGTTSGTVTIAIALATGGQVLTPNPATTRTVKINRAAPVITAMTITRTSSGFTLAISGYSNTREITGSSFHFVGTGLTASDFSVPVTPAFTTWYNDSTSAAFGTQFLLTMPFTLSQGAVSALTSVQATLTNSVGSGSFTATF